MANVNGLSRSRLLSASLSYPCALNAVRSLYSFPPENEIVSPGNDTIFFCWWSFHIISANEFNPLKKEIAWFCEKASEERFPFTSVFLFQTVSRGLCPTNIHPSMAVCAACNLQLSRPTAGWRATHWYIDGQFVSVDVSCNIHQDACKIQEGPFTGEYITSTRRHVVINSWRFVASTIPWDGVFSKATPLFCTDHTCIGNYGNKWCLNNTTPALAFCLIWSERRKNNEEPFFLFSQANECNHADARRLQSFVVQRLNDHENRHGESSSPACILERYGSVSSSDLRQLLCWLEQTFLNRKSEAPRTPMQSFVSSWNMAHRRCQLWVDASRRISDIKGRIRLFQEVQEPKRTSQKKIKNTFSFQCQAQPVSGHWPWDMHCCNQQKASQKWVWIAEHWNQFYKRCSFLKISIWKHKEHGFELPWSVFPSVRNVKAQRRQRFGLNAALIVEDGTASRSWYCIINGRQRGHFPFNGFLWGLQRLKNEPWIVTWNHSSNVALCRQETVNNAFFSKTLASDKKQLWLVQKEGKFEVVATRPIFWTATPAT